ncbi:uncharacterized protein [Apostichopus japonicus]|uniref:uncharacterized protein n=1 Tax=Stichopus japonicus TaxID=307972 RepID=UPI003AB69123
MDQELFKHAGCKNIDALKFKRYFHDDSLIGLSCEKCLSEWLEEDYLPSNNLGEEILNVGGKVLCLMKKPNVDKFTFKIKPGETEIRNLSNLAEYLVPGDHIKYKWFACFYHHAIVKEVTQDSVTLIHWQGAMGQGKAVKSAIRSKIRASVVKEKISETDMRERAEVIFRCDYEEGIVCEDSKVLTLARAKAWLGETGYLLLENNCEHFAVFCKIGSHWSFQQEQLIKCVLSFLLEISMQAGFAVGFDVVGSLVETVVSESTKVNVLGPQMQSIGLGFVVIFQGVSLLFDLKKSYKLRNDGNIDEEEFVGRFWHNIYNRLDKVFFTGVVPTGCVVALGALLPAAAISTVVSIAIGAICAGVLAIPWGYNGELCLGSEGVSCLVRKFINHRDENVTSIRDLSPGDHVVLYRWFLHPRCHMVVTAVDQSKDIMCVIRFTYQRGVVEEKLRFHTPMFKVIHPSRPFAADEVIKRARRNSVPAQAYDIFKFNCKHFAFWCETNTVPSEP